MEFKLSDIKKYDRSYSNMLGIFNPYESFPHKISDDIPEFDIVAYKKFHNHNFIYDKLFIVKCQDMKGGILSDLKHESVKYPIFIKPRYGHKTSSSKDCYKIKSYSEVIPHLHKEDMMWSEFVDATEGMTDFVLINGKIVYEITYKYSDKQNGFSDDWKYISSETKPPEEITEWVNKYMTGYTGALNIQYRANKIIEVGLRFARGGIYIESTENKHLVDNINDMWVTKTWNHRNDDKLNFTPYYSFKCWSSFPIFYILPQHIIDCIMKSNHSMPFYEYYFEPTGTHSLIFFQFMHKNFEQGMQLKRKLECIMMFMNIFIFFIFVIGIIIYFISKSYGTLFIIMSTIIYLSNFDNSLNIIYKQYSNQSQFFI